MKYISFRSLVELRKGVLRCWLFSRGGRKGERLHILEGCYWSGNVWGDCTPRTSVDVFLLNEITEKDGEGSLTWTKNVLNRLDFFKTAVIWKWGEGEGTEISVWIDEALVALMLLFSERCTKNSIEGVFNRVDYLREYGLSHCGRTKGFAYIVFFFV